MTAQETPATFEFSFSNPGARSLGLSGAFAALADDATAAFANPAGLVQLIRPEVSVEGRRWDYTTPYVAGGRYEGEPTGLGLDTVSGLHGGQSRDVLDGLSYASVVYPLGSWSFALYTHQLAKFRSRTETQGLFHLPDESSQVRSYDRRWSADLDVVSYGVTAAVQIDERLSVGFGMVLFDGSLAAPFSRYFPDDDSVAGIYGDNSFLPERRLVAGDMAFDDADWGVAAGVLWRGSESWSVGGFYRQGPEVEMIYDVRAGPMAAVIDPSITPGETVLVVASRLKFPDVYGVGLGYRSTNGRLACGFEWDRVAYSTIFGGSRPVRVGGSDVDADLAVQLAADDGDELRLGAEYVFLEATPAVAVRIGAWLDPDHRFHSIATDSEHRALFPRGDDEIHVSVGAGLAFEDFQVDVGADFSDLVDTVSLSMIFSF